MASSRRSTARLDLRPIFLAGSRATGAWDSSSDYDIVVVLPLTRIPRAVGRLAPVRIALEHTLAAPVSLNPLPAFQLWRSATNLYVWKLHTEGTVLFAPEEFPVERPAPFQLTATSAYSYLMTAAFVLLDAAGAPEPAAFVVRRRRDTRCQKGAPAHRPAASAQAG